MFSPPMAPMYNLNYVSEDHPFMTCLVKVDTRYNWQKTIAGVLKKCHGVYNFRVDGLHGIVEISGTADPNLLLEKLGRKAELQWLQFGECSNNLFITQNQSNHNQDGIRYLHADNIIRPKLPSYENITRPPLHHKHDYNHQSYDHNYGYSQHYDNSGYRHGEGQIHYRPTSHDDDMACCIVM